MKENNKILAALVLSVLCLGLIITVFAINNFEGRIQKLENNKCNCTVNIDGSIMSVEDGFYYIIEGLSVNQADEVQIMINNSLKEEK